MTPEQDLNLCRFLAVLFLLGGIIVHCLYSFFNIINIGRYPAKELFCTLYSFGMGFFIGAILDFRNTIGKEGSISGNIMTKKNIGYILFFLILIILLNLFS